MVAVQPREGPRGYTGIQYSVLLGLPRQSSKAKASRGHHDGKMRMVRKVHDGRSLWASAIVERKKYRLLYNYLGTTSKAQTNLENNALHLYLAW